MFVFYFYFVYLLYKSFNQLFFTVLFNFCIFLSTKCGSVFAFFFYHFFYFVFFVIIFSFLLPSFWELKQSILVHKTLHKQIINWWKKFEKKVFFNKFIFQFKTIFIFFVKASQKILLSLFWKKISTILTRKKTTEKETTEKKDLSKN